MSKKHIFIYSFLTLGLIIISLVFFIPKVFAVTLSEALTQAYKNNPELNAERENIKVSEEDLNISKGDYLPTLTLSGSKSQEDTSKLTNTNLIVL